jgi:hypothetical protein
VVIVFAWLQDGKQKAHVKEAHIERATATSPTLPTQPGVLLRSEHRLLRQALRLRDGREARRARAVESEPDAVERRPVIGRLAPPGTRGLRSALMVDAGPLRRLRCVGLRLSGGGHEGDKRVADGLLHWVRGAAIERHPVYHCLDDDTAAHELADRVDPSV